MTLAQAVILPEGETSFEKANTCRLRKREQISTSILPMFVTMCFVV